jgi:hypothetical protein
VKLRIACFATSYSYVKSGDKRLFFKKNKGYKTQDSRDTFFLILDHE